ncbi:hypothetical protein BX667DRAFT_207575 [Coemansia mojavensis]|nr:hypothetical protein BX667DRAFT_207575 [Coemansia mojavensis]
MLIYAWCNYNYQPIRAKNLVWTTLIYLSTVLWFVGNIVANGHVFIVGVWTNCKLWIIWFRVFFCFIFAAMTIVRFYALDRVFNQKKPFTTRSSLVAAAIVVLLNAAYCLVNQLLSGSLTVQYIKDAEVCDGSQWFRNAAIIFQWIIWTACGYLMFRLRNIQSSFNEFRESMAIFVIIILLLIESTVINVHFRRFPLQKARRIEKTVVDMAASTLVVWLFIGYPVIMSIFNRRKYEVEWIERLANDRNKGNYKLGPTSNHLSYAEIYDLSDGNKQVFMDSNVMYLTPHRPFDNQHPMNIERVLSNDHDDDGAINPLHHKVHVHEPLFAQSMFSPRYVEQMTDDGRRVL